MSKDGIQAFWEWWPGARPKIEAAIKSGAWNKELIQEINQKVNDIESGLEWELGPGQQSEHAFCLSPTGNRERRMITERWKSAAPPADDTWEFYPARQPRRGPELELEIGGYRIKNEDIKVAFAEDSARERIDVALFHPSFPKMADELKGTIVFLVLDGLLGEDGVERWIGAIDIAESEPLGALPLPDLRKAVEALAKKATGERFAILRGQNEDGWPVFAMVNLALKRIDHLLFDMYVEVEMDLKDPDENGLARGAEAEDLNALEEELTSALGDAAVFVGRETGHNLRVLYYFASESSGAAREIEAFAARHPERRIEARWQRDPSWEAMQRWR